MIASSSAARYSGESLMGRRSIACAENPEQGLFRQAAHRAMPAGIQRLQSTSKGLCANDVNRVNLQEPDRLDRGEHVGLRRGHDPVRGPSPCAQSSPGGPPRARRHRRVRRAVSYFCFSSTFSVLRNRSSLMSFWGCQRKLDIRRWGVDDQRSAEDAERQPDPYLWRTAAALAGGRHLARAPHPARMSRSARVLAARIRTPEPGTSVYVKRPPAPAITGACRVTDTIVSK